MHIVLLEAVRINACEELFVSSYRCVNLPIPNMLANRPSSFRSFCIVGAFFSPWSILGETKSFQSHID